MSSYAPQVITAPPTIESLSPDLQYQLWERQRRRSKASWLLTAIAIAPAAAFVLIPQLNGLVTGAYRVADFFNLVSDTSTIDAAELGLEVEQAQNAQTIIEVGRSMDGITDRDIQIALMTASQESNLYNLDHGDDWWFQQNGWGETSDSRGLFQQRDSWGTEECRMNAECSAKLFYEALLEVPNRDDKELGDVAQAVQNSAFPDHYDKWEEQAIALLDAATKPNGVMEIVDKGSSAIALDTADTAPLKSGDMIGTFRVSRGTIKNEQGLYTHEGVDVATPEGTPLFVFGEKGESITVECETQTQSDGSYSGWGIYGTFHVPSTGQSFLVAHLSECTPGTYQPGEVWGFSGNTGKSTGPHTHTEQFNGTKTGYAALPEEPTRAYVEAIHGVF